MECFQVRYDSRVVIYEHKLFMKLATVSATMIIGKCRYAIASKFDSR